MKYEMNGGLPRSTLVIFLLSAVFTGVLSSWFFKQLYAAVSESLFAGSLVDNFLISIAVSFCLGWFLIAVIKKLAMRRQRTN